MPVKKKVQETTEVKSEEKITKIKKTALSATVYSLVGAEIGTLALPAQVFGQVVNVKLLSQAMRVYVNNLKSHYGNTKTRGEVVGSTRKIVKQKGTGGARHGAKSAPIFVHGGIAMGPKFRNVVLELPKKMKKQAIVSALSQKAKNGEIMALGNLEKATGKTKELATFAKKLNLKTALIVSDKSEENIKRSVKNIKGLEFVDSINLNAYEIIKHKNLIFTKEAVEALDKRFKGEEK